MRVRIRTFNNSGPAPVSRLLPAVQWVSVECGRVWQHLFVTRRRVTIARLCLIGRLTEDTMSRPSALQPLPSTCLILDASVQLSTGLVLVGGANRVPQVPVPQTCQSHFYLLSSTQTQTKPLYRSRKQQDFQVHHQRMDQRPSVTQ